MSQTESFRAILQNDSKLIAKWNEVSARLIADAQAKGISITPENLISPKSARLSVLCDDPSFIDGGKWEDEAKIHFESWSRIEKELELIQAIGDREHAKHAQAQAALASMTPEERIKYARSSNLGQKAAPAIEQPTAPETEAAAIEECNRGSTYRCGTPLGTPVMEAQVKMRGTAPMKLSGETLQRHKGSSGKIHHIICSIKERNVANNPHQFFTRDAVTGELMFGAGGLVVSQSELLSVVEGVRASEQSEIAPDEGRYE